MPVPGAEGSGQRFLDYDIAEAKVVHIFVIQGVYYKADISVFDDHTNYKILWVKILTLGFPR